MTPTPFRGVPKRELFQEDQLTFPPFGPYAASGAICFLAAGPDPSYAMCPELDGSSARAEPGKIA
jgi:hypothetical protein